MSPIIRIENLTKKFGDFTAVDHLNLEIEEGEILGLLGPNGAGKTTTILMLATVIKPTEGTAYICGYDIRKNPDKVRELLGVAFQESKMLWMSTPWDIVNWHAKICGISTQERKRRVREVLEALDIWEYRHRNAHTLSGGMRKRVEIAKVMIQRPKIAIVDEPTAQIDVVGKHKVWRMLRELREEGTTIILATNELYEADMLSDRVGIMHRGKLLVCDTPQKLKDSIVGGDVVEIQFETEPSSKTIEELSLFKEIVKVTKIKGSTLRLYLNNVEEVLPKIMNTLMKEGATVSSIRMSEPSLDDVFAHYTGLTLEEAEGKRRLMQKLLYVVERDVRLFFQYKVMIIMRAIWFASQIAFFGLIASRMIAVEDYFRYYVSGLSIMTLYSAAIFIGFDIYEEAEHGVFEYLLSLPVSRRQLVLGRSIGGGLRAFIYVGPLLCITLYIVGITNFFNFLLALFSLFLFAFGVAGMSITLAVAIKSSDRFDILMGVLDALIVRLSTAMYPLSFVREANPFYGWIANFNPVTYASELFRLGVGIKSALSFGDPLLPFLGIVLFFGFFTLIGIVLYEKTIEGGGWR